MFGDIGIILIPSVAFAAYFGFTMGVRRERGRLARIRAWEREEIRTRKGVRLRPIRVRR